MDNNIINEIEETCEIDLNWFYHSIYYNRLKYLDILTNGIKCRELLNKPCGGNFNGKYYISLSKITIPDNPCFLYYSTDAPSFIIDEITPIKCEDDKEYYKYIDTRDSRRIGNFLDEYQYYYFIQNKYIKGIVYDCFIESKKEFSKRKIKNLLELIDLLKELNIEIPIYDYSRRDKMHAHEINKEKIKYYSKRIL